MVFRWLEQTAADVPNGDDWLNSHEMARLSGLRFAKRRADWRLGRWTAKLAVASMLEQCRTLAEIEIRAAPSGAPQAFCDGQPMPVAISISHRAGVACCAMSQPAVALGCDLELIEPRSNGFIADYFTDTEQTLVSQAAASHRLERVALIWSAKESALKALKVGLRADTRSVVVKHIEAAEFSVTHAGGEFHGCWQSDQTMVRTLVAECRTMGVSFLRSPQMPPQEMRPRDKAHNL
jgi:4'-phosphopantetheinyl transferase